MCTVSPRLGSNIVFTTNKSYRLIRSSIFFAFLEDSPPTQFPVLFSTFVGLAARSDRLPPMTEVDEDVHLWVAAAVIPTDSDTEETEDEMMSSPSSVVHIGAPPQDFD